MSTAFVPPNIRCPWRASLRFAALKGAREVVPITSSHFGSSLHPPPQSAAKGRFASNEGAWSFNKEPDYGSCSKFISPHCFLSMTTVASFGKVEAFIALPACAERDCCSGFYGGMSPL